MLDTLKCEEQSVLVNYNVVEGICASGSECSGPLTVSYALSVHRVEWSGWCLTNSGPGAVRCSNTTQSS